jgi:hypothetical protein
MLPLLSLAPARNCAAQAGATNSPAAPENARPLQLNGTSSSPAPPGTALPRPLTAKERWKRYVDETFLSAGPYVVSLGAGLAYQAVDYPQQWGGGFQGFGRRSGTQFGILAIQNTIHEGGEAALHYDPRYFPCRCTGFWRRSGYAVEMTFLTYDEDGHKRLDLAQLAGAYGSGAISALWYPKGYSVLVQGMQTGHLQLGFVMGTNLFEEFRPEFQRTWPFRKFLKSNSGNTP